MVDALNLAQTLAVQLRDSHIFVVGLVAVIVFLATTGRRTGTRCPNCQEVNRDHANYCAQCGTRLPNK